MRRGFGASSYLVGDKRDIKPRGRRGSQSVNRRGCPARRFSEMPIWHDKRVAEARQFCERKVAARGVLGDCVAWLRIMVG
jgi:hypothetical protein